MTHDETMQSLLDVLGIDDLVLGAAVDYGETDYGETYLSTKPGVDPTTLDLSGAVKLAQFLCDEIGNDPRHVKRVSVLAALAIQYLIRDREPNKEFGQRFIEGFRRGTAKDEGESCV
jgi:hypothetical protein